MHSIKLHSSFLIIAKKLSGVCREGEGKRGSERVGGGGENPGVDKADETKT